MVDSETTAHPRKTRVVGDTPEYGLYVNPQLKYQKKS